MTEQLHRLPYLTPEIPGIGGTLRAQPEDFQVQELPAYQPSGTGTHIFVEIEKRGLTTPRAASLLAAAVGVNERDLGWAGMKDRHAVSRQWLSFPPPVTLEQFASIDIEGISILRVSPHEHKLRTGHLKGNRFILTVRNLKVSVDEAISNARAVFERLGSAPGAPNWYGGQRFGAAGDNAERGRKLLKGEAGRGPRGKDRRLLISSVQSALFNEYLRRRLEADEFSKLVDGDVLQKTDSGGMFASIDAAEDQPRMDRGEVVPTGPMFGPKMKLPRPNSPAEQRDNLVLQASGLSIADFARERKLAEGTRRALAIRIAGEVHAATEADAITVEFCLPSGSYATAVMREVMKPETDFPD